MVIELNYNIVKIIVSSMTKHTQQAILIDSKED